MGSIGFLNGAMGMANAQRTINYIRVITEFINQPEYRNVIPMWGIINEAQANVIGDEVIRALCVLQIMIEDVRNANAIILVHAATWKSMI